MADQDLPSGPLPASQRVVYERNPLIEVICQVRFPPVLRIVAEPPAEFQERIRGEYPLMNEKWPDAIELPQGIPALVADVVKNALPKGKLVGYDFASADEKWKVSLTREFLALTTTTYRRWEEFRTHLHEPLNALMEIYTPAFFNRVGLRYQDLIRRSALGLGPETAWADLLKPHVAGILAVPELAASVDDALSQTVINFPCFRSKVRINYGIVQAADSKEDCYLIDSDFFTDERTNSSDVHTILDYFNRQSGRLFHWCIQDRLHAAMEPVPVEATV
jgi:uncharacterized protein (TIGR04255 family)